MRIRRIEHLNDDLHQYRTAVVEETLPESGLVLDIGPGRGELFYRSRGCTAFSLDIDPRTRPAVLGDAERLPFRDSSLDFIIATEVIEHVRHPKLLLDEIRRAGKPGGTVLLSTPNVAHMTNRLALLLYGDFCDDRTLHDGSDVGHIHFFTRRYFMAAVRQSGLSIIRDWSEFVPVTPRHYIAGRGIGRSFPGLAKQMMFLCRIDK